jgi:hypothetical protein
MFIYQTFNYTMSVSKKHARLTSSEQHLNRCDVEEGLMSIVL